MNRDLSKETKAVKDHILKNIIMDSFYLSVDDIEIYDDYPTFVFFDTKKVFIDSVDYKKIIAIHKEFNFKQDGYISGFVDNVLNSDLSKTLSNKDGVAVINLIKELGKLHMRNRDKYIKIIDKFLEELDDETGFAVDWFCEILGDRVITGHNFTVKNGIFVSDEVYKNIRLRLDSFEDFYSDSDINVNQENVIEYLKFFSYSLVTDGYITAIREPNKKYKTLAEVEILIRDYIRNNS